MGVMNGAEGARMLMKMLMDRRCAVSSFADPLTRNINFARLGLSSETSQHSLTPTRPIACGPIATYAQIKLITAPASSASVYCILPH